MDNATYDEINLPPINTDETYSRLGETETKIKPSYELQKRSDIDQSTIKGEKQNQSKEVSNSTKFNTVMIIMMVILLLLTLISIILSLTTFDKLKSEQTNIQNQLHKMNNDIKSALAQFNTTRFVTAQTVLDAQLVHFISQQSQYSIIQTQKNCGLGLWHRIIFLNMSDPSQECPPTWKKYTGGARACGRPTSEDGSCATTLYPTGQMYSRVCGRVIGYQQGTPDAFGQYNNNDIDLDGINITRGTQHNHIWSYVAGHTRDSPSDCPCSSDSASSPPQSVRDRYYCDSDSPTSTLSDDPLWDSQQCEGTCRTGINSPPWFSVQLPAPTTDAIEVKICCDQSTSDEDVPVELIEIYVQ